MPVGVSSFSGAEVARRRKRRGWTQMDLAIEAGINYQIIGLLERGTRPPIAATVRKLACALRCRESDLLTRRNAAA